MTDRLPGLNREADRAFLDWRDQLLTRCLVTPNCDIILTKRLSLICGLRLWSLCEQNLPFWTDLTIGQVLSEENVLAYGPWSKLPAGVPGRSPWSNWLMSWRTRSSGWPEPVTASPSGAAAGISARLATVSR